MLFTEYPIATATEYHDQISQTDSDPDKQKTFENTSKGQEPFFTNECPPYVKKQFFIRVYLLLALQWLLTASLTGYIVLNTSLRHNMIETSPFLLLLSSIISMLIVCNLNLWKNNHPFNMIILFMFSILQSLLVSCVCALYYEAGFGKLLMIASGNTACIFVSMSLIGYCKKNEFQFLDGWLTTGIVSLLCMSFVSIFLPKIPSLNIVMTCLGCLIFSGFVLYDTSVLVKRMGPDDVIEAVITLYLDSMNLFLFLLDCLRISTNN